MAKGTEKLKIVAKGGRDLRATAPRVLMKHRVKTLSRTETRAVKAAVADLDAAEIVHRVTGHNARVPTKLRGGIPAPHANDVPNNSGVAAVASAKIWRGGRCGFRQVFSDNFWLSHQHTPCAHSGCAKVLTVANRSIDHVTEWRAYILGKATSYRVCTDEAHWDVYLAQDVHHANEDLANLVPMCQSCNSSKNASRQYDGIEPAFVEACPGGDDCAVALKAD